MRKSKTDDLNSEQISLARSKAEQQFRIDKPGYLVNKFEYRVLEPVTKARQITDMLDQYASLFEKYGAILNAEAKLCQSYKEANEIISLQNEQKKAQCFRMNAQ